MMLNYHRLQQKPKVFKSLTGVTLVEFDELLDKVALIWLELKHRRLDQADRQRAIGGGLDYKLALRERLLMTLVWLRLYLTTESLGFFFGVSKSTVSRNTRNLLPGLHRVGDETLGCPDPPKRREGKNVVQAL